MRPKSLKQKVNTITIEVQKESSLTIDNRIRKFAEKQIDTISESGLTQQ